MSKPMIIKMSGPPACGKTELTQVVANWCRDKNKTFYIEEERKWLTGDKEKAEVHIYIKQTM